MHDLPTIILDTETGGTEPHHPTIEVGAIAVCRWKVVDELLVRIRFDEAAAEREALALNSYDPEIWKREAVDPADAIERIDQWLQPHRCLRKLSKRTGNSYTVARVAGWQVRFDCERIERGFKSHARFLPAQTYEALDLMQVARGYFWDRQPAPENMKLGTVAAFFGISTDGAHGALADCRLALQVAERIMA